MLWGHVGSPVTGASQPPAALGAPQAAPLCAVARTPNVNRAPHRTVPATAQVSRTQDDCVVPRCRAPGAGRISSVKRSAAASSAVRHAPHSTAACASSAPRPAHTLAHHRDRIVDHHGSSEHILRRSSSSNVRGQQRDGRAGASPRPRRCLRAALPPRRCPDSRPDSRSEEMPNMKRSSHSDEMPNTARSSRPTRRTTRAACIPPLHGASLTRLARRRRAAASASRGTHDVP